MDIRRKQRAVVDALEDIKGRDIVVFNTERLSAYFERVVIASGDSTRQVKALADNVERKLKELGARVAGTEGGDTAEWVLVDLGDIVVHVMHPTARATYNLEELWGGKDVKMKRDVVSAFAKPGTKPAAKKKAPPARKKTAPRKAASAKPRRVAPRKAASAKPRRVAPRKAVSTKSRQPTPKKAPPRRSA